MDGGQAKRIILVSTVGTGVLSGVAVYRRTDALPGTRVVAGVFISGVLLAAIAEFQPAIAGGLAALMLTTAAFALGGDAWEGISGIVGTSTVKGTPTPSNLTPIGR